MEQSTLFWQQLKSQNPNGFVGLSPMDGVTDLAMRIMTARYGQPEVIFTEFTNVEGWRKGAEVLRRQLWTKPELEGPVIAQLYGLDPENFRQVAQEVVELGFAGVDINMGCPAKNVAQNGAGAGLIKNKNLAQEIFLATKEGVADRIPVSIKTRTGTYEPEIENWLGWVLAELKPAALTIHGRTYKQGYAGEADWGNIAQAAALARELSPSTVIIGNGDVKTRAKAMEKTAKYQVDGVLIGRAAFGNPWVFAKNSEQLNATNQDKHLLLKLALEHAQLYEELYSGLEKYSFLPMRKHLAWYTRGFPGAAEVRVALTQTNSAQEVAEILEKVMKQTSAEPEQSTAQTPNN